MDLYDLYLQTHEEEPPCKAPSAFWCSWGRSVRQGWNSSTHRAPTAPAGAAAGPCCPQRTIVEGAELQVWLWSTELSHRSVCEERISFIPSRPGWFLDWAGKRRLRVMIEKDNHNK